MRKFTLIPKEDVEKLKDSELINGEYNHFNDCDHYIVDMSDLNNTDNANWMNTISIKLPNGKTVTICVMELSDSTNIDMRYYGVKGTRVIGFKEGKSESIKEHNLYAVIGENKKKG